MIQAGHWGRRPAWDVEALFRRFARAGCGDGGRRAIAAASGRSIRRWRQHGHSLGSAFSRDRQRCSQPMGGDHRSLLTGVRGWILERIAAEPDLTIEELRAELGARGVIVGYGTVWRFFAREDITFKKKRAGGRARAA